MYPGGGVVETEVEVWWDGCDRYYVLLCGGGGMTSFLRVVSGQDSNSVGVGVSIMTTSLQ